MVNKKIKEKLRKLAREKNENVPEEEKVKRQKNIETDAKILLKKKKRKGASIIVIGTRIFLKKNKKELSI